MTVSAETDRNVIQALAQVARLGEYTLASVTTSDDAQKRVLTIKFSGVSSGFVQDYLPYDADTTPLIAHANGRGEVERIDGLQPGDLAETEDDANAEIEAAADEKIGEATGEPRHGTEIPLDLTPKQHAEFPCHSAAVTSPGSIYDHNEPKVVYLCSDPTSHMDADAKAKYKKKVADGKRDTYGEQRHRADEVRKQVAQAREARLPVIREQLKSFDRPTLLKLALESFVTSAHRESIAAVLGLDVPKGKDVWAVVAGYCNVSEANLIRAAAAVAINIGERAIGSAAESHASGYYFDRADLPRASAVADWFKTVGIELSEVETKALEKAAKT